MYKALFVYPEKCVGCGICELVCSMVKEGKYSLSRARIKVINRYPEPGTSMPIVCVNCKKPLCSDICRRKAFRRDKKTGALIIDKWDCDGCKKCVGHCFIGAISMHPDKGIAVKCDLCDGDPVCVNFCPTGAIEYTYANEVRRKLMNNMVDKFAKLHQT